MVVLSVQSLTVDFAKEREDGYRRIFSRSPLLTSLAVGWKGLNFAYDYLPPGETPEVVAKQHGIGVFTELPTSGVTERILDGKFRREQVVQGQMVIAPADVSNSAKWDMAGGIVFLGIEPSFFTRTAYEVAHRNCVELTPHFATLDPLINQIALALKTALEKYSSASLLYAQAMTNALIVHLLQYYCGQQVVLRNYSGGLSKYKLKQVVDYIQTHFHQDITLEELATIAQMSSHYFCQLFKKSMSVTPHQYVIQCRVDRAKELLSQKELTIAQVAKIVGFVDQSHFHRHFKRLTGITPRTFQQ